MEGQSYQRLGMAPLKPLENAVSIEQKRYFRGAKGDDEAKGDYLAKEAMMRRARS